MPFQTLTSDGLSIACMLIDHNWQVKPSVSVYFPSDVTVGLSNRESRMPEAEAAMLSIAVEVFAADDEAQELRQQLATIGKGWVGVPIVSDQFLGSEQSTTGARIFDAQRLIDLTSPAIVAGSASLVPGHVYAPLLVGHVVDLPEIRPASGTLSLCSVTVEEDSPWAFRIAPSHVVEPGIWPASLLPEWSDPPTQTPVKELVFERVGMQRERTIAGEERAFHWTTSAGFALSNKSEIATLIGFFIACRGQWAPFDASLWFTPGTPTSEAPHETKVRFASNALKLSFVTPFLAEVRVKFTQVPWEILGTAGETPQQAARIFLYQVTYDVPQPVVYRFTNCWRPLTRSNDGTYAPAPWEHKSITGGLDLTGERVSLTSFMHDGNPLAMFNPNILEAPLLLRVYEVQTDPIDPNAAVLRWFGSITAAPQTGRKFNAECTWLAGLLEQEVPGVRVSPGCNTYFCSPACGHLKSAWAKTGTLATSDGSTVVVACSDGAAANTYAPGLIEVGAGAAWESRTIVASAPAGGGQSFTLDRPIRQAAAGQTVTYLRSCDRSKVRCKELDASGWRGRFRGHPNLSQVNLSLPDFNLGSSGGKK